MKDVWRQLILLFAVMGFMTAATLFILESDPAEPPATTDSEANETEVDPENLTLVEQSVEGWRLLRGDIQTGWSAVMNLTGADQED